MAEVTGEPAGTDGGVVDQESEFGISAHFDRPSDAWRSRLDELVQLDLAGLDLRDEVHKRFDTAENVSLDARSRLAVARQHAGSNLGPLRLGIEQLRQDRSLVYAAAESVVRRAWDN